MEYWDWYWYWGWSWRPENVQSCLKEVRRLLNLHVGTILVHEARHGTLELHGHEGHGVELGSLNERAWEEGLHLVQLPLHDADAL